MHNRCIYPIPCTLGLRCQVPTRPRTKPSMQFLFVGSHLCTPASFGPSLAESPLPSASGYVSISSTPTGDLHPIRSCPCRAYTRRSSGTPQKRGAPQLYVNRSSCISWRPWRRFNNWSWFSRRLGGLISFVLFSVISVFSVAK